jgi:hypothetical protein
METKMTIKTMFKSAIAAALTLAVVAQAQAETQFSTLAGIEADPMNAAEMEATQGKNVFIPSPALTSFNASIAAALGVTPNMINAQLPFWMSALQNGFSFSPTVDGTLNNLGALVTQASGGLIPFAPVQSPFPANFPAASSGNLNLLLGLAAQPGF